MKLISKRGNLSAPGLDGITFPFIKLEKESAAEMLIAMLRFIIVKRKIPRIWKTGKTILIFKGGEANNPGNWRPITLTSILYRIIFGRISQAIMDFESRPKRTILSMAQKGFVPRINGCGEHVAMANMAINRAMTSGNILYMMALDMKDAFGSVSHKQLNNNLKSLGLCKLIREVIMDSYNGATVKVITLNGATENIHIKRGVKQGCPLSPVLFDICINPLIEKLNSRELKRFGYYWNDEDGVTAQAYADDILLFANSFESLRELVEIVNDFNCHSNIQLNPKKCEILKIGKDRNVEFIIQDPISKESNTIQCKDGTNVVRYLGIPLAT
jgi:hypothetical protein